MKGDLIVKAMNTIQLCDRVQYKVDASFSSSSIWAQIRVQFL